MAARSKITDTEYELLGADGQKRSHYAHGPDPGTDDLIFWMMPASATHPAVERVLAAVGQCLDRPSAEALLRLRAGPELQARIEALADKSTEGQLTPAEREEYETLICVGQFVALLQANARQLLAQGHTS